jgi:hypothetical protein
MDEICDAWGFKLLFEIVEHLEQKVNPQYARDKFDNLLQFAEDERTKEYLQKKRPKHFQDKNEPPGASIGSKTQQQDGFHLLPEALQVHKMDDLILKSSLPLRKPNTL